MSNQKKHNWRRKSKSKKMKWSDPTISYIELTKRDLIKQFGMGEPCHCTCSCG